MSDALTQQQFLNVIDRDEAERRFRAVLDLSPLEAEQVLLASALGRVLAEDIVSPVDVPGFDRSNVDGFAVRAEDTYGAAEDQPQALRLNAESIATGQIPTVVVAARTASPIATGAVVPRGANAVVMIEHTKVEQGSLRLTRPVTPGANVSFAGTDVGRGEIILRKGDPLGARDTGVLAAIGIANVPVIHKPRVAILSTGDELVEPGKPLAPGMIYDSNATVLADAVRELGGEPVSLGIIPDNYAALTAAVARAIHCDVVLMSGGTSKGAGDVSYRVLEKLGAPGVIAHGVALKPGKPLCLAAVALPGRRSVPVAVLPGFPTSAVFTFHEFLAPVISALAGRRATPSSIVRATLPMRANSERGRTEYLLVSLVQLPAPAAIASAAAPAVEFAAYPMGKGSGSVTTFSHADGFIVIPRQREYLEAGEIVDVHRIDAQATPADLIVIGSHCTGLDLLLSALRAEGFTSKCLAVGSMGGLEAARRGECDLAGIHLLDPATDEYNRPFVDERLEWVPGYGRLQGIVFRPGDGRFEGKTIADAVSAAVADPECHLVNRNRGSGTRVLIDRLLQTARPPGFLTEARSHNAVAAAVAQGRADWGVAIEPVARDAGLGFIPLRDEQYDFVVPRARRERAAVRAFIAILQRESVREQLRARGFRVAGK